MVAAANMVEVAALVGDTILAALMGGQALTATELAFLARISRPTASEHLARLAAARLIAMTRQGRFHYYRIASPLVAQMLESMKAVAAIEVPSRHQPRSIRDDALRFARTCYDHFAGRLGVAIADALIARGRIMLTEDGGAVTEAGSTFFAAFGAQSRAASACSAARASTGASAACTSPVWSGRLPPLPRARLGGQAARFTRGTRPGGRARGPVRGLRRGREQRAAAAPPARLPHQSHRCRGRHAGQHVVNFLAHHA
jgi:DNA-binding transcriptional ArsR family regulator